MAAAAMLDFQTFEIFRGPIYVTVPNFIKIGHTAVEIWQFYGFQNGRRPPSWICEIQIFKVRRVKTVELCISPVYRRLAVAKFSKFTM